MQLTEDSIGVLLVRLQLHSTSSSSSKGQAAPSSSSPEQEM